MALNTLTYAEHRLLSVTNQTQSGNGQALAARNLAQYLKSAVEQLPARGGLGWQELGADAAAKLRAEAATDPNLLTSTNDLRERPTFGFFVSDL